MSAFYIVWSPDGPTPPQTVHKNHASACHAMHELARRHPGREFHVMGKKGKSALVEPDVQPEAEQAA